MAYMPKLVDDFCSAHALPRVFRELMTDSNSDIIEFYPSGEIP